MSSELFLAPSQSAAETPVTPVLPNRGPIENRFRNLAVRGTLVFAAALSPLLAYDSALAGPGQSPTTQKDDGPKCWEVFGEMPSNEIPVYAMMQHDLHDRLEKIAAIHREIIRHIPPGDDTVSTITLDCDTKIASD